MLIRFIILLAAAMAALSSRAYEVRGTVTDSIGEGLPYVTYRILTSGDEKLLSTGTADDRGIFSRQVDSAGTYRIEFMYAGMSTLEQDFELSDATPVADLGTLVMREGARQLAAVSVTAQRPLVVRQIDRIGYDVKADPDASTMMVNDILRKVPMVSVDPDGTIKVNGSTDFKIYKNGRPNNSMSRNAKDLFASMPASMIKRIEVITEPGAEYDAEGTTAILNIVTDESASIKGVLGNVNTTYQTLSDAPSLGAWITTEIDKFTVNVGGGWNHLGGRNSRNSARGETLYPDGTRRQSFSNNDMNGNMGYFGLDGSLQLDTLNLFTAGVSGWTYRAGNRGAGYHPTYDAAGNLLNSYRTINDDPRNGYTDIDANFNYQHNTHRKGETITLSYLLSHTNQASSSQTFYSELQGMTLPYSAIIADYSLDFYEHTAQADYTRELGQHSLSVGAKGIFRRNHSTNNFNYVDMGEVRDEFKHVTDIAAIYAQYSIKLRNVSLRAGLRYEYSHLKASYPDGQLPSFSSNLNDLVPSAAASWQINDANSLSFNYSTSIARPGISYLNPAVTISPTTLSYGNPDLSSARRQSLGLTYMLIKPKFNVRFTTNYEFSNNGVASINFLDNDYIINSTYGNVGHTRRLSFTGFTQWTIDDKTTFMLNASANYNKARQQGMSLSRWGYNAYGQLRRQLPWKISAQLFAWCGNGWTDGVYGYTDNQFMAALYYGLSLRRNFLKQDRLSVGITFIDPFSPHYKTYHNVTVNGDYTGYNDYVRREGFQLQLQVSYRFGSLSAQVKKTARTIENDDLVGRKNE